jgi:glycosyltransferase involved in cell wall biosynthesis
VPLYDAAAVSPFQGSAAAYRRTDIFPSQDLLHRVRAQAVKNSVTESASSTNARTAQLKVLISAYACEPDKGSEAAVGWNWVLQISRSHEVWVITRENNQERIEKAAATKPLPNVHWVYFDLPRWARFWKQGERGVRLYYYLWQIGAYFCARKLHQSVAFNLLHHVTFGQYWTPPFPALLPIPFIWGPVGGGESAPRAFKSDFSNVGRRFESIRDFRRTLASIDPLLRLIASRSRFAIATTEETAGRLRQLGAKKVIVHPQFGMTEDETSYFASLPSPHTKPFRVISMGRNLHWKGFHLSLRAFAKFLTSYPDAEYWITGHGPESHNLQALALDLGIEDKVVFWGKLATLKEVYAKLAEADLLVHPALHEAFGNVCLEAMAAGRPVVCLDLGGPALQVTEDSGIKVRAKSPEQVVSDLADAFYKLATDHGLRSRLSFGARNRAQRDFNWKNKGLFMAKLYHSLCTVEEDGAVGGGPVAY